MAEDQMLLSQRTHQPMPCHVGVQLMLGTWRAAGGGGPGPAFEFSDVRDFSLTVLDDLAEEESPSAQSNIAFPFDGKRAFSFREQVAGAEGRCHAPSAGQ